ncbi:hypothetical protein D3C75_774460 [compost metagenome]
MQRLQRWRHGVFLLVQRHFVGRARAFDQFGEQEQRAQRQGRVDQVEQRRAGQRRLRKTNGAEQGAGRNQDAEGGHALQALRGQDRHRRHRQGDQATVHQPFTTEVRRGPGLPGEQQCPQAQHGIQADLGHDGEQRSHRRAGGGIGRHQPEVQRPDAGLDQEGHGQDRRAGVQQAAVGLRHQRNLQRQVGHVQGAGHAIQHRCADQEQRRGEQVDGNVMQAGTHPGAARAMQQQAIGSGQQHLEEHEQVEQVGGEEGAVQTHQLDLEQCVEAGPGTVPAGAGKQQGTEADDAGEGQQQGRQVVDHQHDAERRRPVAWQVDTDRFRLALGAHPQ